MSNAMSGIRKNKSNEAALAMKLVAGTEKHLAAVTQVILVGGTFTPAQLETQLQLQAFATLRSDVDAAKAAVKAKLEDERTKGPAMRALLAAFVGFVQAAFGGSPDILADFGLTPKKGKKPLTAEQQAAANAKRTATRKARGTMGKRKKLAIVGNVKGVTVTPIIEPSLGPAAHP